MLSSKSSRNAILVTIVAMLAVSGLCAAQGAGNRRSGGVLGAIPAKSLFCIRINDVEVTLDAANAFLKDVAPASFDAKASVFSKLGSLLGDNELKGVNKNGNIAIFAVNVPGETEAQGPMGNMFIGALLPVTEYEDFISGNPNCGKPDEQGISTITVNGQPRALTTNFRRSALFCPANNRGSLIKVKEMLAQREESLGRSLNSDERRQAASSPVWVYLNIKQGSQIIQPMLFAGLEKMKTQLEKAKESGEGPPMDPAGIIGFYSGIFKTILSGTENITVGLAPSAEACKLSVGLKPIPDTMMAAIVGKPLDGDLDHVLGYLEDGSIFNVATKVDRESFKTSYMGLFDLMGAMVPGGIPEADLKELKEMLTKGIDAMGDSLAVTFGSRTDDSSPFVGKYVIEVKDQAAFEEVLQKELLLMKKGEVLADIYKGLGMKMDVEVNQNAGTYKGVQIGSAKATFEPGGDGNDMQSKMFEKMFGDGLNYCWAFEKGNCVYTLGSDADKTVRELIDQVRAGGPKKINAEIKAAMDAIPNSKQADAVGTINYARMIKMALGFMPLPADVDTSQIKVESSSNIAFAGRTTEEGKLAVNIVMPKKHLQEIQSVFKQFIPIMEQQHKAQSGK